MNKLFYIFYAQPCTKEEGFSYPKCIVDYAREMYEKSFTENDTGFSQEWGNISTANQKFNFLAACWHPMGNYLAQGSSLPLCRTKDELSTAYTRQSDLMDTIRDQVNWKDIS